jgi:Animal haem peroxidase
MHFRVLISVGFGIVMVLVVTVATVWFTLRPTGEDDIAIALQCAEMVGGGLRDLADDRRDRFLGKVGEAVAGCRGGAKALAARGTPWVDWSNYWGAGDASSKSDRSPTGSHILDRNIRGVDGALLDLEYQRMELIKFNLFDNLTIEKYLGSDAGPLVKVWPEMRLRPDDPDYGKLLVDADGNQLCQGELIRFRTLNGICNDLRNPAMGSTGQLFARNVQFETTFPEAERDIYAANRHGGRISLLQPDPQVISRRLFTRDQTATPDCNHGHGVPGSVDADCSYRKAPFFNVLAAFWIQFMTHDWFSHLDDARNDESHVMTSLGCASERAGNLEAPLTPERVAELGCRPEDTFESGLIAADDEPGTFQTDGGERLQRAPKTTQNFVTAWWDASQIYGFDERSESRVRRDPTDPAKLEMVSAATGGAAGDAQGYLPQFRQPCQPGAATGDCDSIQPEWVGQEATAFPDNWSIGLSFYHNLFAREHNNIVDAFRQLAKEQPAVDSGLRNPVRPDRIITYGELSNDELFGLARLIVAAEIAKIHTIEWTPQLLYDEPLYIGMNSNWSGLFGEHTVASDITESLVRDLGGSNESAKANQLYAAFAAGAGIIGHGNSRRFPDFLPDWLSWDRWSIDNPDDVNGGTNHFGSPFNFPEEFVSVYRLHALVPDMIEFRDLASDPNAIMKRIPVIDTFRGQATSAMHEGTMANWSLSLGRQRLGLLLLHNHPQFLQNLDLSPRFDTKIDVGALDIIRDRERGVPRFNEFRRQIGLRQLTGFDDFIDAGLPADSPELADQRELVATLRDIYGQHVCDASKVITTAQTDTDGKPINDCLGHPDGSLVDNIEDVDLVVGFHAETTRPHGFAISETQFQIFIINASRRLFSDRFFTSSFRPEFYTKFGIDWVMNNGPTGKVWEKGEPNGHRQEVSPLKRVLLRAMPELAPELDHVVNAFDPWGRDRGEYYTLAWKPRPDAVGDPAFAP